jgi:hypothetical protein
MLGTDMAVRLVQRLLSPSGSVVLEACRALWMLQGLQEHFNYDSMQTMDTRLQAESERLESDLEARLSVAGSGMSDSVALMNDRERHMFRNQANQQRQNIVNQSAWSFRQLLCLQHEVLAKLDVPGFEDGPTVDAETLQFQSFICQYLHSAFYIRTRMGIEPHEGMLRSQLKKLLRELEQQQGGGSHSPKMLSTSSPVARNSPVPTMMPIAGSYGSMSHNNAPMLPHLPQQQAYSAYQQQPPYQTAQIQPMMMMTGQPGPSQQYYPPQQYPMSGSGEMMMYSQQPMMMQQPYHHQHQQQQVYSNMPQQQQVYNNMPPQQFAGVQQQQQQQQQVYNNMPPQYPPYYQQ